MTMKPFDKKIYLSSPTMHGDEIKYMQEAYETNWMSTIGHNVDEVERLSKELVGCSYAVALSCGTAALHLAVKLAGVKRGDVVLCSDMTFAATVNPVVYEGGVPVFVDSEYETWNMDPAALRKAFELYPHAKAVIVVNLYGTPAKLDEISAICKEHGALLIEDAAESLGATYRGRQTGSFGTYNVVSFNGNKIITGSSGGVLLTDDRASAEKARKWSTQSRENAPWYQHEDLGYNYRMSNVIAGVVRGQYPYLAEHIALKKAIYARYQEAFKELPIKMNPCDGNGVQSNYWLSCMTIDPKALCEFDMTENEAHYTVSDNKTCPAHILEELMMMNAEGRPIWKPMHMQPIYRKNDFVTAKGLGSHKEDDSVSRDVFTRGLCLPSDIKMTQEEQNRIIEIVKSCF